MDFKGKLTDRAFVKDFCVDILIPMKTRSARNLVNIPRPNA